MLVVMIGAALAAGAADSPKTNPLIEALARCPAITADAERLACFDAAAARLVAAERARELVVVSKDEVKKTRRSLFGLAIDENDVFAGRDAPADRIDRLETTIAGAGPVGGDKWSLVLTEGGRWRTTEGWANARPKPGMAVTIKRGPLGSYMLSAKGERAVKVLRVN